MFVVRTSLCYSPVLSSDSFAELRRKAIRSVEGHGIRCRCAELGINEHRNPVEAYVPQDRRAAREKVSMEKNKKYLQQVCSRYQGRRHPKVSQPPHRRLSQNSTIRFARFFNRMGYCAKAKAKRQKQPNLTSPLTSQSLNPSKTSTTSALQATTYSSDYSPQQYHPHPSKPNPQSHSNPA
jgi:hypothetical protein